MREKRIVKRLFHDNRVFALRYDTNREELLVICPKHLEESGDDLEIHDAFGLELEGYTKRRKWSWRLRRLFQGVESERWEHGLNVLKESWVIRKVRSLRRFGR